MLTLHLNLLAPEKKKRLVDVVRFLLSKELVEIAILTACLTAIAHLAGWLILVQALQDLTESAFLINRAAPAASHDIRSFNKLFKDVATSAQGYTPLTPRLVELATSLPPTIKLTAVIVDHAGGTLLLNGVAQTRAALLEYENQLKQLAWLSDITEPPSLLFQKENIDFELKAQLKNFPTLTTPPHPSTRLK